MLKVTTVYITHDRAEAAALAHHVAYMREGRVEHVSPVTDKRNKELITLPESANKF